MMTSREKCRQCSYQAAEAQDGIARYVLALRRKRCGLEQIDARFRKEEHEEVRHQLDVLKRSLLEPMRLLKKAYECEKELASIPSVGRVKQLERLASKRKEDFASVVQTKYEERDKAVRIALNQMLDELKETPAHDVDSLSKWFNEKFPEFPMEDVKDMITLVGGVFEGDYKDQATMVSLATIPPREVLLSQIAYLLKSPMQRLAIAVNEVSKQKN